MATAEFVIVLLLIAPTVVIMCLCALDMYRQHQHMKEIHILEQQEKLAMTRRDYILIADALMQALLYITEWHGDEPADERIRDLHCEGIAFAVLALADSLKSRNQRFDRGMFVNRVTNTTPLPGPAYRRFAHQLGVKDPRPIVAQRSTEKALAKLTMWMNAKGGKK